VGLKWWHWLGLGVILGDRSEELPEQMSKLEKETAEQAKRIDELERQAAERRKREEEAFAPRKKQVALSERVAPACGVWFWLCALWGALFWFFGRPWLPVIIVGVAPVLVCVVIMEYRQKR